MRVPASLILGMGSLLPLVGAVPVDFRILDETTKEPIPARTYLSRDGSPVLPEGRYTYKRQQEIHFLAPGEFTLELEPGTYQLQVERGLEYRPHQASLDIREPTTAIIPMRRWIDLASEGWWSGDTHVHVDPKDMELILRAEDLHFAPTITHHVWDTLLKAPFGEAIAGEVHIDETHAYTANAQEIERIMGGPGSIILFGPGLPLPFSGYQHYPPAIHYTREVHARGGYVEEDKPFWLDTFVNAALGEIDFVEINCNHFFRYGTDTDLARLSGWPQEMGYMGGKGMALWFMNLYYRMLGCGFPLKLTAGSAYGIRPSPAGFNRVYVKMDKFSVKSFWAGLKAGRSFTTNGPVLDLKVNGEHGPGSILSLDPGQKVRVSCKVRSRIELEEVELLVNGRVAHRVSGEGRSEITFELDLDLGESSWIALRAFERAHPAVLFGHTNPIYVLKDGRNVAISEDARRLLERVDRLIDHTEKLEGFKQESHREETLKAYRQAREVYSRIAGERARAP
ncbi:MAG: hypothetical protein GHCLOJNM_03159 [bacterium]|nr:hypothetical protein [bacterium]